LKWEQLSRLGRELPEVVEDVWFRTPALKVRGKSFTRLKEHGESVVFLVECVDEQEHLIEARPNVYFITDHYRGYAAVLARLAALRVPEARLRLERAWRQKAPRALVKQFDAQANEAPVERSLDRLRQLCLALPEVTERLSHGSPTWFVRGKKTFVTYSDHHHGDRLSFWCAAPPGAQAELVETEPDRFFRPPYVGGRGWLGVYLDVPVDWDEIADIVEDAYRVIAPKTLVAQLSRRG